MGSSYTGDYKNFDLSKVKSIYVEGSSRYESKSDRDYFNSYLGLYFEYEDRFYFYESSGGGHDDNAGGTTTTKEVTREEAVERNSLLYSF